MVKTYYLTERRCHRQPDIFGKASECLVLFIRPNHSLDRAYHKEVVHCKITPELIGGITMWRCVRIADESSFLINPNEVAIMERYDIYDVVYMPDGARPLSATQYALPQSVRFVQCKEDCGEPAYSIESSSYGFSIGRYVY